MKSPQQDKSIQPDKSRQPNKSKIKNDQTKIEQNTLKKQQKSTQPRKAPAKKIEQQIRPVIDEVSTLIQSNFQYLHNKYLLNRYKAKVGCYQTHISQHNTFQSSISTQSILSYYNCYQSQKSIGNKMYNKLVSNSAQNKLKFISCIEKCSQSSKEQENIYLTCSKQCKRKYQSFMFQLYQNFYNKVLNANNTTNNTAKINNETDSNNDAKSNNNANSTNNTKIIKN